MKDNLQERFPIVDEEGTVIGQATRGECHNGSRLLHAVVHLHVFNAQGDVYLQKRPEWKDIQPGKWDTAVGGHIDYGETPEEALRREVREETGLIVEPEDLEYCGIVTFVDVTEPEAYTEFMHVFRTRSFSGTLLTDCDEGELEWVPIEKINDLPHWQADEIFLDFLAQNKTFFSLKAIYKNGRLIETYLAGIPYNHFGG